MLRTTRTYLRNLLCGDVDNLLIYRNDPACSRYQRYEDTSKAGLQSFVQAFGGCDFPSLEEEQHYAIAAHQGEMIGDLSIFYSPKDICFTLGITIAPQYQRQGYAFELLEAVVSRLRTGYPGVELVALIDPENAASIALFEKLGFTLECYAKSIQSCVYVMGG